MAIQGLATVSGLATVECARRAIAPGQGPSPTLSPGTTPGQPVRLPMGRDTSTRSFSTPARSLATFGRAAKYPIINTRPFATVQVKPAARAGQTRLLHPWNSRTGITPRLTLGPGIPRRHRVPTTQPQQPTTLSGST